MNKYRISTLICILVIGLALTGCERTDTWIKAAQWEGDSSTIESENVSSNAWSLYWTFSPDSNETGKFEIIVSSSKRNGPIVSRTYINNNISDSYIGSGTGEHEFTINSENGHWTVDLFEYR